MPRFEAVQPPVSRGDVVVQPRGDVEDVDLRQIVPLPDPVVVRIVGGRHLHHAGAECRVDEIVGDDRDLPVGEREKGSPARRVRDSARPSD